MSTHDRGTFGALLAEAKERGATHLFWSVDLKAADDDETRWGVHAAFAHGYSGTEEDKECQGQGRTGEEALRRLVEKL